jgi:hypothetical protein
MSGEQFGQFLMIALFILVPWVIYRQIKRRNENKNNTTEQ